MRTVKKILVVGDRVLISPEDPSGMTKSGLYLPPGVQEKEKIQGGYVVKIGPGYPIPNPDASEEPWAPRREPIRYLPLQVEEGDYALFLRSQGVELEFEGTQYLVVPQAAILVLVRQELVEDTD
ncbi:MAG: co-chaperone GroES [Ignavibacteriae bacterium]|nr:co-chaperone GroES [Ignavibacteriota bacterium]